MKRISNKEIKTLRNQFSCLIGLKLDWLSLPVKALPGFEPSQTAVIINTLIDAALPQIELASSDTSSQKKLKCLGLTKATRSIGEREAYPDYIHKSGKRVELKGLFIDNPKLPFKRPPTKREPSARLKDNVTTKDVDPGKDVLLIAAVQLKEYDAGRCYPTIVDIALFPMIDVIDARDKRLSDAGGLWIKGVPKVVSNKSRAKFRKGEKLSDSDFEHDTNFGKLKRIPYKPLQDFMSKYGTI